jgi:hypothetical protein
MERWGGRCVSLPEVLYTAAFHAGRFSDAEHLVEEWLGSEGIAVLPTRGEGVVISFGRADEVEDVPPHFRSSISFGAAWQRGHDALGRWGGLSSVRSASIREAGEYSPLVGAARTALAGMYLVVAGEVDHDHRFMAAEESAFQDVAAVRAELSQAARRRLIPLLANPRLVEL